MKLRETLVFAIALTVIFSVFSTAGAASIPNWVKGVAGWWSQDKISEQEFLQGIDYLISSGAIKPKILEEKDAKIKSLEAELAKYKNAEIEVAKVQNDKYSELRQLTKSWVGNQISDAKYVAGVQGYVDSGLIGPFNSWKNPKCCLDAEKKTAIANYRSYAAAWASYGLDDDYFIRALEENLYKKSMLTNPKGVIIAEPEKTSQDIYDEQQDKQAVMDNSHAELYDNAKQYYYGYISTETYLENIVQMYQDGVFLPFLTYSQQVRGDYDTVFVAKAISGIVQDKALVEELRMYTQQYIKDETDTGYIPSIGGVFGSSLGK